MENVALIDKYQAYEILADLWNTISTDLEIIQVDGVSSITKVDPKMIKKKKNDKEEEIQDGWKGHILPFELVQDELLSEEKEKIENINLRLSEISEMYKEKLDELSEDDKAEIEDVLNDENNAFVNAEVKKCAKGLRKEKKELSLDEKTICEVADLIEEESLLKKSVKTLSSELSAKTKKLLESMTQQTAFKLLEKKWIYPLITKLDELPKSIIDKLTNKIIYISKKYETTLVEVDEQIKEISNSLTKMIDELVADEDDTLGLLELKKLLGGD